MFRKLWFFDRFMYMYMYINSTNMFCVKEGYANLMGLMYLIDAILHKQIHVHVQIERVLPVYTTL